MRKLSIKKVCEHCGTSFTARTTTTRFCSDFCAKRAYKRRKRLESAELTNSKSAQTLQENLEKNIPEVMGPRLAAEYMSVHVATIYRYLACGILKAAQLPGKTLIRKADLDMIFDSPDGYRIRPRLGHAPPKELTTVKATAERYGLSFAGAYKIIKDNKVPTYSIRGKAYYSMSTITSIFRKREENSFPEITEWYTAKEIQENYGMTEAAVYSFASDNGIPRKKVKGVTLYSKPHTDRLKRKDEIKSRMNPRRTVGHIPEEPLMSMPMGLDEVCAMTERSRATIYRLTSRGEIPFYKNGNKLYFFRDEIIDWIKEGKKSVTRQRAAVSKPYTRKKKFVG